MSTPAQLVIEVIYDRLALGIDRAIDTAGAEAEALFLAKLALALGNRLNDADAFQDAIENALLDLAPPDGGSG